ncbi:MAG TPA: hypothetical protein VIL34_15435 [Actinopolymorphaceae bacterium]|jgi:hypothetical protein
MVEVYVRPESIHQAARKVDAVGRDWSELVRRLRSTMDAAGDPYGDDGLGRALRQMYESVGPTALRYFAEAGECVVESGAALNHMASAYTHVERENTERTARVGRDVNGSEIS